MSGYAQGAARLPVTFLFRYIIKIGLHCDFRSCFLKKFYWVQAFAPFFKLAMVS